MSNKENLSIYASPGTARGGCRISHDAGAVVKREREHARKAGGASLAARDSQGQDTGYLVSVFKIDFSKIRVDIFLESVLVDGYKDEPEADFLTRPSGAGTVSKRKAMQANVALGTLSVHRSFTVSALAVVGAGP